MTKLLSRADVRTPTAIDQISAEWLSEVLQVNHPDVRVASCEVEKTIWGMAAKSRVRLTYDGDPQGLPETMYVKANMGAQEDQFEEFGFHSEVRAQQYVVPHVDVNTIGCYYAGIDAERRALLLLEDLDVRGVSFCRVTKPINFEQASAFLDIFARIHAKWWDSPELAEGRELGFIPETLKGGQGIYTDHCLQPENWAEIIVQPQAMAVPRAYRDRERVAKGMEVLKADWHEAPQCVMHGDEHIGNLFFDRDGSAGVYDWELRKSSWAQTFSYFLIGALDIEDRRRWEGALLEHYLGALRAEGVAAPSFDKAWEQYRRAVLYGLFVWLTVPPRIQSAENNVANCSRFGLAALDHDTFSALGV